jgi:hypothetical protein
MLASETPDVRKEEPMSEELTVAGNMMRHVRRKKKKQTEQKKLMLWRAVVPVQRKVQRLDLIGERASRTARGAQSCTIATAVVGCPVSVVRNSADIRKKNHLDGGLVQVT